MTADGSAGWAPDVVGPWAAVVGPIVELLDDLAGQAGTTATPAEKRLIVDLLVEAEHAAWRLTRIHHTHPGGELE